MFNYNNKIMYIPFEILSAAGIARNLEIAAPVLGFTKGVRDRLRSVIVRFQSLAVTLKFLKRTVSKCWIVSLGILTSP
jgi:hypothetical protein